MRRKSFQDQGEDVRKASKKAKIDDCNRDEMKIKNWLSFDYFCQRHTAFGCCCWLMTSQAERAEKRKRERLESSENENLDVTIISTLT